MSARSLRSGRKPGNTNPGNYGPRGNGRNNNKRVRKKTTSSMPTEEKSDFVYYVSFKEGPMGLGLDPPPGMNVGSLVSIVVEQSQADQTGLIRVGDSVEQVGMVDIRKLNHEDTSKVIQSARRPVKIKFRRAPYHLLDTSKEESMKKLWKQIEGSGIEDVDANDLINALEEINIILDNALINTVIDHLKEDFEDENLDYEDFLHNAFEICKKAGLQRAVETEKIDEASVSTTKRRRDKKDSVVLRKKQIADKKGKEEKKVEMRKQDSVVLRKKQLESKAVSRQLRKENNVSAAQKDNEEKDTKLEKEEKRVKTKEELSSKTEGRSPAASNEGKKTELEKEEKRVKTKEELSSKTAGRRPAASNEGKKTMLEKEEKRVKTKEELSSKTEERGPAESNEGKKKEESNESRKDEESNEGKKDEEKVSLVEEETDTKSKSKYDSSIEISKADDKNNNTKDEKEAEKKPGDETKNEVDISNNITSSTPQIKEEDEVLDVKVQEEQSQISPEKQYYIYTAEEVAARKKPYYKSFQLQEAYAQTLWCKKSKNTDRSFLSKQFRSIYNKFGHTEVLKISKKEEKEVTFMDVEEAKKAVKLSFTLPLYDRDIKLLLPPRPSDEELENMKPKEREQVLLTLTRVTDEAFIKLLLVKNSKALKIQTLFRQYSLRQRCKRRLALKTGKAKVKKAYRGILLKLLLEKKETHMEEFEVTYTGDGGIGLGLDPPQYWRNGGSIVTVVIPGGQAFTQGKVKKGDYLISVGGINVTRMSHDDTVDTIRNAGRPVALKFRRMHNRLEKQEAVDRRAKSSAKKILKTSNRAKRSHKAKKIADSRIQQTREEIQAAKDEALRLKRERAAARKKMRQQMRHSVEDRVKRLEGRAPERAISRAARCPICTIVLPCQHYKTQEEIPVRLPESNKDNIDALFGNKSRPSTFDPEIGVDLAPLQFVTDGKVEKADNIEPPSANKMWNDYEDISYDELMESLDAPIDMEKESIMNKEDLIEIIDKDNLPLRFRVTLSRLEKRQYTAQRKYKKKRNLVATPPVRKLVRAGRRESPRERSIRLLEQKKNKIRRRKERMGYSSVKSEQTRTKKQKPGHHQTPNGSMFHLCLVPPTRQNNDDDRTPTPPLYETDSDSDVLSEPPKNKRSADALKLERMNRLDYMLEQRKWAEERVAAALKIQAAYRGYDVRNQDLEEIAFEHQVQDEIIAEERREASIKIQAMYRKRMAEQNYKEIQRQRKEAAATIQRVQRKRFNEKEEAAKKIQAITRGRATRNNKKEIVEKQINHFRRSLALRGVFQRFDTDHDGKLSETELKNAINNLVSEKINSSIIDPTYTRPDTIIMGHGDDFLNFMMEITACDPKNHNVREPNITMRAFSHYVEDYIAMGEVEREMQQNVNNLKRTVATFISMVTKRVEEKIDEQNEHVLIAMFHKFDTDRSGDMDLVELRKMLTFYSKNGNTVPSVLETRQLMQMIDQDNSHRMEMKEWVSLMMFGLKRTHAERKKMIGNSSLHKKLNNFTFAITNGVNRFLTNLHELWCMYDKNHVGFLEPGRVGDMLQRAYKNIYKQTNQVGEPPATPKQPPSNEDVKLFIGVINSTCDNKHHAHDQDGNTLLTEDAFTLFMLQGLRDAEGVEEKGLKNKRVKAVYKWRHKVTKLLMWQE